MPVLGLNTAAMVFHVSGRTQSGDAVYGAGVPTRVSIIKAIDFVQLSPIRSEASASHGRVEEDIGNANILFLPTFSLQMGDRVDAGGNSYEVIDILPREDLFGRLNHYDATVKALFTATTTPYVPVIF